MIKWTLFIIIIIIVSFCLEGSTYYFPIHILLDKIYAA